jgi:hypothetical protein
MRAGMQSADLFANARLPSKSRAVPEKAPPVATITLSQSGTVPRTASAAKLKQAQQFPRIQRVNPGYVRRVCHSRALKAETLNAARAPTMVAVRLSNCTATQPLGIEWLTHS